MISRAVTNLLKNAGESIEDAIKEAPDHEGEIRVSVSQTEQLIVLEISDNGAGLPQDRSRLMEPYVTSRAAGTGLGLSIVTKIIEEHRGTFSLSDAEPFDDNSKVGAKAVIKLPRMKHNTEQNMNLGKPV
jgi:two-component system nitrogen regulation sensor histidine kinase NtrY